MMMIGTQLDSTTTANPGPPDINNQPSSKAADSDINKELQAMQDAFELATKTNMEITLLKTEEGAKETAAQQRPNIG